ncbi:MAG TPA: hypothetical protein ENK79_00640, partial [Campylobacterales bacterium]|nr:hypothetical protein [Campylobacterales bacterium]
MRKKILLKSIAYFTLIFFVFTGCGSNNKEEAKKLLQKILQVVGIPYNMVVNICQDGNGDGICNATEVTAKISINKNDTVDSILQKFQLDENGQYIIEHYNPKQKILMEIADNQGKFNTGKHVTLPFTPKPIIQDKPQELSILQSLVDNGFLLDTEYQEATQATKARNVIDQILLENVFQNQQVLEEHNLTTPTATIKNLEFIAEGLKELNVTELVENLDKCNQDNASTSCEQVIIQTDDRTEINKQDAQTIKDTNSTKETTHTGTTEDNNKTIKVSDDGNVTVAPESSDSNTTTSSDDNNSSSDNSGSSDNNSSNDDSSDNGGSEPAPNTQKSEKNAADGYIIKLSSPATAKCYNSDFSSIIGTYNSNLNLGAKGKITFNGVTLNDHCSVTVPKGS